MAGMSASGTGLPFLTKAVKNWASEGNTHWVLFASLGMVDTWRVFDKDGCECGFEVSRLSGILFNGLIIY